MKSKITTAFIMIWASTSFATETPDFDVNSLIRDVSYQYEISPNIPWMCLGSLTVNFDIPDGTEKLHFYYSRSQRNPPRVFTGKFLDISEKSSVSVTIDNMMPHAHFSALFYINGNQYRASNFSVRDYIAPEDLEYLEMLLSQNEVEDIAIEEPFMEIKDKSVTIICDSILHLMITTIDGENIINKRIDKYADIPLEPGIYVLTFAFNQNIYTKKIMIK